MDKAHLRPLLATGLVILVVFLLPMQVVRAGNQTIYAATSNGLYKSTDGAASWFFANAGVSGHTFSLLVDPANPDTVYAGTLGYGVFKTTDGGGTWSPAGLAKTIVPTLALDPNNPNTIYAGTAGSMFFSGPVYKSGDGGANWTVADTGLPGSIVKVLVTDSSKPAVLYAGTNWAGVFKTTIGGDSWAPANAGLMNTYVSALTVDPADSSTVYLGIAGCSFNCAKPAGFFKSTDGGTSWGRFNNGLTDLQVISLAVDPTDTGVVYAGTRLHGLFKSVDGGMNWTLVNSLLHPTLFGIDHFPLIADPLIAGTVYAGTTDGMFKSTDSGINWTPSNDGLPPGTMIFALALRPASGPTIESVTAAIQQMNLGSELSSSLISELNTAQAAIDDGNLRAARSELRDLINLVLTWRQSGYLDTGVADSIITSLRALMEELIPASRPSARPGEHTRSTR